MAHYAVKYLDRAGNEVLKEEAAAAIVTEYDEEGNPISETFGSVEPDTEVADQPQT